jgi:glycosyltransferase involved in cell wall biosynthesis
VREGALRLHPHTPTALPHCALVLPAARGLAGAFDATLDPREALADFCARATAAGLAHVVADEVLVAHRGAPAGQAATAWPGEAGVRHPSLPAAVADAAQDRYSALARALLATSVALEPLEVTVDARALAGGVTGTVVHVVELLGALAERDDVRVRALMPDQPGVEAARAVSAMDRVQQISLAGLDLARQQRSHVVHRPWQIESVDDLDLLDRFGERLVVTHQDLIGYRTASAFESTDAWRDYRAVTRAALGVASMVLFFSAEAAADAGAEDLVEPARSRVVALGADGRRLVAGGEPRPPAAVTGRDRPFLLVLGNRFRHKNVRFALELLAALREEHGWDGDLVVAGAEVLHGSGSGDDAAWLLRHPLHSSRVVETGAVGEAEKAWLMREATAVVYPSTYEGFGLIPFEAAAAGTPCLVAPVSAMRDTVPAEQALLVPWDAAASARRVIGVLRDAGAAEAHVAALREAGSVLTWEATAAALAAAYGATVRMPPPSAAALTADIKSSRTQYWAVRDRLPPEVWPLIDPEAPLLDVELIVELTELLSQPGGRERLRQGLTDEPGLQARIAGRVRRATGR